MGVKTFTLKEANRVLPKIKGTFDDIFVLKKKIAMMKTEMDWLREFWGKDLHDADNPDSEKYGELADGIEGLYTQIVRKVGRIQSLGCIVKDADAGLVDFYSVINNEVAFLCWKYGEKSMQYWHSVEGGFRGRQPLSSVNKINK